ncbi:MAG: hypothetical protein IPO62_16570 [Saprospiraceae bacterium]|nr:hypothetical protein [Saprospiraceae bacterium]
MWSAVGSGLTLIISPTPNDETFGKVVTDLTLRRKVVTKDLVCRKYCERNDYTGYPGFVQSNAES